MNNTNPIESITAWTTGVGHGPESVQLYTALTLEECVEMMDATAPSRTPGKDRLQPALIAHELELLSRSLRAGQSSFKELDRTALLDAALGTAWVALCLARALTGDRLPEAWAELHRSNVTDKQRDGKFVKDASGEAVKPHDYRPADFAQFLLPAVESEGVEATQ